VGGSAHRPRWVTPALHFSVSLALGVFFTWLAMREVDFSRVGDYLATVDYWLLLPYIALLVVTHLVRTWRWGMLLSPVSPIPFRRMLPIASVGFMAIVLLPFRMGEFVRPYLVSERGKLSFSAALATCVVERVIDGLLFCGALFVALAFVDVSIPQGVVTSGHVALAIWGGLLAALVLALWKREASLRFWRRVLGLFSRRLAEKLTALLASFIDGLRALPEGRRIAGVVGLSGVYWFLSGLGTWVLFQAFHFDLPLVAAFVLIGILVIGIMVPGGPGFAGPFEVAVYVALVQLFGLGLAENASFTIVYHGLIFAFQLVVGVIFLFSSHVSFLKVVGSSERAAGRLKTEENAPP
jgi:uncharacterized protein (TIRG00374 family)